MRRSVSARGSRVDWPPRSCVSAERSSPIDFAKAERVTPVRGHQDLQALAEDRAELALIHAIFVVQLQHLMTLRAKRAYCNPNATSGAHSHIVVRRGIASISKTWR